ncbi:methyl-CpG-binding domain-containing protein 9 isoform X2 [Neltuma alba]|uniref:methyl-CpG-binding domain-containing protein 9 isoform X2 n=1 Tax=Neltuma alba TaxID=207710 RepID=UPI0010A31598|nr:methyl-CpG-binding domain-containing protein 9 isoform X2 [Prosopis alba]
MELTDSGDELRDHKLPQDSRSGLGIDLNEIPSPSFAETLPDSIDIVRAYHENPAPPPGGPAGIPGDARGSTCGACGKPEARGHVVVCDGCERGYHLGCAGMRGRQAVNLDEWVCGECVSSGVKSKRWPLGVKSKHLLDINASPPSDADGEGSEELQDLSANSFGAPLAYSNFYNGNAISFQKASGAVTHAVRVGFEDVLNHTQSVTRNFEEVDMGLPPGRHRNSKNTATGNPGELILQALRDFISERHGVLEEGWKVDFRQPIGSSELYAVYCAPDGKIFDSVFEVACYLGLMPGYNSLESEMRNDRPVSTSGGSHLTRKRKAARLPVANGFAERRESFTNSCFKDPPSDAASAECANACGNISEATLSGRKEDDHSGSQQSVDGLPLQFEDFFVLSLGKVDDRPSYCDANIIWPVGYRSCWHDKMTGSIFTCEVLDGGDSGPLFRVRRCSCSDFSIPVGSTVLSLSNLCQFVSQTNEDEGKMNADMECDGDESIQMILDDSCNPTENDVLSCLESRFNEVHDSHTLDVLQSATGPVQDEAQLSDDLGSIGEIVVEECSSSLAWKDISQKLVNACSAICKQKGALKLYCKHADNETCIHKWDMRNGKNETQSTLFAKFCGSPVLGIPAMVHVDDDLESLHEVLRKWLEQDRFGLDVEFVQEVLELLPGVEAFSRYEFLNSRSNSSSMLTVGNGFLVADWRGRSQYQEEAMQGLYRRHKKVKLAEECVKEDHCPPPGKPLYSRVPFELVGDVFQAWELLRRFHEILGLKEPLSLDELEKELINPWFNGSVVGEKPEGDGGGPALTPNCEAAPAVSAESPHAFIQVETEAMKEAAQVKLASFTYTRCFGASLTKAHNSLLEVLIGELQSKVAALVDPNFDPGELRTRRGRRKDIDNTIPARRAKLNMLPINELTWPELARRYILAVLSMDGNLDSPEITAREGGKVFRCLQGDGGLLCGSLTGVAGMEADALLLAESTKKIFGSASSESDVLTFEDEELDAKDACEKTSVNDGNIPEWAQLLEPVRKLPTNVGTRIRKCVNDALLKDPPEWARKILQHSISKEVYKGNASGPTKKAVLSVLADVCGEGSQQKPNKARRKKTVISIPDIIMKQCRIVLRRAAAEDDSKVFCNLLGQKLINSSDNDDEGLLGSPAMVSRPLDFRTIDLRLAAGAYGGSHEAFLEDVHELWNNVRIAFGDQPDLVELADKLSENFEMLYDSEVLTYVQRFGDYAKLGNLSAEMRKEVENFLASTSEIPKAPWDEGVCKVCGIDRDDDSVLLCDTCDAEYHTYCLNPPLARIPEGNWYCPSCVDGKHAVQDVSQCSKLIGKPRSKKFKGEVTSLYLEALSHLLSVMEEKEYWEYSVGERTILLKFLCDELLNSSLIRQHLEQCAESSAESHQKLRALSAEWKSLKIKEEILSSKAAKIDTSSLVASGEVAVKEGLPGSLSNPGKCLVQPHSASDSPNNFGVFADGLRLEETNRERNGLSSVDKSASTTNSETDSQNRNPISLEGQLKNVCAAVDGSQLPTNMTSCGDSQYSDKSSNPFSVANNMPQEINSSGGAVHIQSHQEKCEGRDSCLDLQEQGVAVDIPKSAVNESEPYHLELNAIRHDISLLQESITSVGSQLLKLSVRREFLGIDSLGRFYWASAMPSGCPCILADSTALMLHGGRMANSRDPLDKISAMKNFAPSGKDTYQMLGLMKDLSPLMSLPSNTLGCNSPWAAYQTDAEIEELLRWLKDYDPRERELKDSIMIWHKSRFQELIHMQNEDQVEPQGPFPLPGDREKIVSDSLVTKATSLLEKRYGPFLELGTLEALKKRGKKVRPSHDDKLYRCQCLEPIWPSRQHCMSCHKTLLNDVELEGHNDGKCSAALPASEKNKDISGSSKGRGNLKFETALENARGNAETGGTSMSGGFELSSRLIKFSSQESTCPYNFEDVCSKFVTEDSNKELIKEIGLIDSDGIPSFVSSVSPYASDSTVMLISNKKDEYVGGSKTSEGQISIGSGNDHISGIPIQSSSVYENNKTAKSSRSTLGSSGQRDGKSLFSVPSSQMGTDSCCVVPQSSLRPLVGKVSHILRLLKIGLLDMDAALPEVALRPSKAQLERRQAWRSFVKSARTIYEMVQATITLEDMIKTEYLRNDWWYWSSLSAAAKSSTLSSLALRIYTLDSAIIYEKMSSSSFTDCSEPPVVAEQKASAALDAEKSRAIRKSSRKRKEPDG